MRRRGRPPGRPRKVTTNPAVGRIDVKLPRGLIEEIEKQVTERIYLSKADFVRSAVREKLRPGAQASVPAPASSEK